MSTQQYHFVQHLGQQLQQSLWHFHYQSPLRESSIYSQDPVAQSPYSDKYALSMDKRTGLVYVQTTNNLIRTCKITGSYKVQGD